MDFFFDLLLLLSSDLPLDFLDLPPSLDLSVFFFDAAVSEPFVLDLLLLSDFVEADFFFSEPFFFLDLLLSDFGDFFISEALDFVFLDSSSVLREPFILASALSEDSPFLFFETTALLLPLDLDLLDLDFFEDLLDLRLLRD